MSEREWIGSQRVDGVDVVTANVMEWMWSQRK